MMSARWTMSRRGIVPIVAAVILWSSVVTVALAADKTFTASVAPGSLVAGASYGSGARAGSPLSLTITNTSDQARLGSANVTPPAGVLASAASSSIGTAAIVGGVIQLRDLDMAPNATVNVAITARVECAANHAAYVWALAVKQANDFKGTGNDLAQVGSTTNAVNGTCGVVFSKQPKSAEDDPTAITNAIYDPSGDPVTVTVMDSVGFDDVPWWSGSIDLAIGNDPSGGSAVIGGRASGSTTVGVVEFAPTIDVAASGYTLTAAASPAPGPSAGTSTDVVGSASFNIVDDADVCTSSSSKCKAESHGPKTTAAVEAAAGGAAGDLVILAINDPAVPAPECGGEYVATSDLIIFDVTASDGTTPSPREKTATLTLQAQFVTKSASKYQVCYQGDSGSARFLTTCANRAPVLPCVASKALDKAKNLVIVIRAPSLDPKVNF